MRCLKDESRQGTTKMVEVILFTTSTQSFVTSMRTYRCGEGHCRAIRRNTRCELRGMQMEKFAFRGSCEASGSLVRKKILNFF